MGLRTRVALLSAALVALSPAVARAQPGEAVAPARVVVAPAAPGRWFVHLNLGVNAYTYAAPGEASGVALPAQHIWPGNRLILLEQLGAGYFVHPRVSVRLTLQFAQYVRWGTDTTATESAFSLFGPIAWAAFHAGPFFVGAGPLFAVYTPRGFDFGIFTAMGASAPVGGGFAIGGAVQMPLMLYQRVQFGISPAFFVAKRF